MEQFGSTNQSEHHFKRVISGDIDSVRKRLQEALEAFNFDVVSEQPLQARRSRKKNIFIATVLEQETRLTVALKSLSTASTLATFDYLVEMLITKGDRQTIEREADAVIALATNISTTSRCASCGTDNPGHVRFCRLCGTPTSRATLPAEVEVMRLTDGARASLQEIAIAALIIIGILSFTIMMILSGKPKAVKVGWWILIIGEIIGWLIMLFGMGRLYRTLNPNNNRQQIQTASPPILNTTTRGAMSEPVPASITEGTTELMDLREKERARVRLKKQGGDTDPID